MEIIGSKIIHLSKVQSTNSYLKRIAKKSPQGTVVIADEQTSGKGRFNRTWWSKKQKCLTFSFLIQPSIDLRESFFFSLFPAVAIVKTFANCYDIHTQIKWPNDILLNGKKVGGILVESLVENRVCYHIIVGIGLNLFVADDDFPVHLSNIAGSIFDKNMSIDRDQIFKKLLNQLDIYYSFTKSKIGRDTIQKEWDKFCDPSIKYIDLGNDKKYQNQIINDMCEFDY